ncbi:DUF1934 domain-containing protein [Virgibacillus doumboii]|uniref:DUF1934 domain-containing protein n=1 Tax=Virgibacillus doumboii TaxID=2697503 RepID=UPI0013E00018|nr:DUF1934 domain-containing protein [Virgibacillus doumboii]
MNSGSKKVSVELQTIIDDGSQKEYNTVNETGELYQKNNIDVLTYEENVEEGNAIKNLITIYPDKVSIKRTGMVSMHQKFRVDRPTENVFQHPHGNIHMETFTNTIHYQELTGEHDGLLAIDYTVRLNGQDERKHQLQLSIKEEDLQ